jgi:hypothetical protein
MRTLRELEPPSEDEGFASIERVSFERAERQDRTNTGVIVAAAALESPGLEPALREADPAAPHLVFDWNPAGDATRLDRAVAALTDVVSASVVRSLCPHPGGAPTCWCRPPLPGLVLAFARAHDVNPARSTFVGASPAHRTLATALGARYVTL